MTVFGSAPAGRTLLSFGLRRFALLGFALLGFTLLGFVLPGCQMDREDILAKKVCSPDGECARGFTCVDGVCELVPGDTASRSQQLLLDAGAPSPEAGATPRESE